MNLEQALLAAKSAATAAGDALRELFSKPREISHKESVIDIVTEADLKSEAICIEQLQKLFPAPTLAEEGGGAAPQEGGLLWVIDPLDGTVNYAHRFPFFAVSIALCLGREPLVGVIYEPLRRELFFAAKGEGAFCNEAALSVSQEGELSRALVATGFPYDRHSSNDDNLHLHRAFIKRARGVRRAGAAALDLAYVAAGRLDGYWEKKLKPWDLAAGMLLVREAGGLVTDLQGAPNDPFTLEALASNPALHPTMAALIAQTSRPSE